MGRSIEKSAGPSFGCEPHADEGQQFLIDLMADILLQLKPSPGFIMWSLPKSSVVALFLALTCFSRDTAADWQGTLWNSSPEQADQAFLVPHRNPTRLEFQNYFGEARIVFDDYQIDDLAFHKGRLNFQDGKLYQIWMELKEPQLCEKLITDLKLRYGTPIADRTFRLFPNNPPDHSVTWYDQENHNQVDVFYRRYPAALNFNDDCELRYIPFVVSTSASSSEK
jgi:hypothetical protein